jgi:hypothetical protein
MSKRKDIRCNIPAEIHAKLKEESKAIGIKLSEYISLKLSGYTFKKPEDSR